MDFEKQKKEVTGKWVFDSVQWLIHAAYLQGLSDYWLGRIAGCSLYVKEAGMSDYSELDLVMDEVLAAMARGAASEQEIDDILYILQNAETVEQHTPALES